MKGSRRVRIVFLVLFAYRPGLPNMMDEFAMLDEEEEPSNLIPTLNELNNLHCSTALEAEMKAKLIVFVDKHGTLLEDVKAVNNKYNKKVFYPPLETTAQLSSLGLCPIYVELVIFNRKGGIFCL